MTIAAAIDQLLHAEQLDYRLHDVLADTAVADAGLPFARAALLKDQEGQVLVITRSDQLLDLAALGRFCGRDLDAVDRDRQAQLCRPLQLDRIPALPGLLDVPVMVDRQVLEAEPLLLASGQGDALIEIPLDAFRQLLGMRSSAVGDFTVALADLAPESSAAGDQDAIISAVGRFSNRRIRQRLEDTLDFPPLPEMAQRIIQLGANPLADIKDLAEIVELDPSLSAQVVSWAASPYYAAPGKIKSVQDAIVRVLGFDLVMNLALGLALGKSLRVPRDGRLGYAAYWRQAVYCAAVLEALVKAMPEERRPPAGLAYLTGLLHNFGFLAMAELFKPQLELVCRYCEVNDHAGYAAVERFLLGITRDQIGAFLAAYWQLPEEVCTAIRFQELAGYDGPHADMVRVLYVARQQLARHGIGWASSLPLSDQVLEDLGLARDRLDWVVDRVFASSEDLGNIARNLAA
jgi:HD-like signal output (HDOD) protein/prolyl-tRNA editing enzyme YbaK/EbsC (Cys-tRNA(Pro) deacylase)